MAISVSPTAQAILSVCKPTAGLGQTKCQGFGLVPKRHFNMMEEASTSYQYPANRLYNVDETGLTVVQSKIPNITGRKGKRQIEVLTLAEQDSTMTIVACMNTKV